MSHKPSPALLVLLCLILAACGFSSTSQEAQQTRRVELAVFAASSLTDAFTEISELFESHHPGVAVLLNFASSSDLATQIIEGAQADVYASANARQMQKVASAGRAAGEPVDFLTNGLVVIVPADNPAHVETLADLAREGIRFVSAAPAVPIRDFTDQVLEKASADPAYGSGFQTAVAANLVSEEVNVRQLAAKVALGEADAGMVYKSDVTPDITGQVDVIEIPERVNVIAVYPITVVDGSDNAVLAQVFIDLVLSDEGQDILSKWGFGAAPDGSSRN